MKLDSIVDLIKRFEYAPIPLVEMLNSGDYTSYSQEVNPRELESVYTIRLSLAKESDNADSLAKVEPIIRLLDRLPAFKENIYYANFENEKFHYAVFVSSGLNNVLSIV